MTYNHIEKESLTLELQKLNRLLFQIGYSILEEEGIHPGQAPLLFELNRHDGRNQKELARCIFVSPPTITVMLKHLETAALIERKKDPQDLRNIRIYLTQKGRECTTRIIASMKTFEEALVCALTPQENKELRRLLLKLQTHLLQNTTLKPLQNEKGDGCIC